MSAPHCFKGICLLAQIVVGAVALTSARPAETAEAIKGVTAYVEQVFPSGRTLVDVATIRRNPADGHVVAASVDLYPGDQIVMKSRTAALKVRLLASNTVVMVQKSSQATNDYDFEVPPTLPGLSGNVLAWFKSVIAEPDQSGSAPMIAGSRGVDLSPKCFNTTGRTNDPVAFQVPALSPEISNLVRGKRSLFVSWRGGTPPYSLTLANADTGATVAQRSDIRDGCAVRLPDNDFESGRYRLEITDSNHVTDEDDSIFITASAPIMPKELSDAIMPDEARSLYFASWLTTLDKGKWIFEAEQQVAELNCRSRSVKDWLLRWGGTETCN